MADLFLVIGLGMAGAVTLGERWMGLGGGRSGGGLAGAFGTGALAALVAAPCTAPFRIIVPHGSLRGTGLDLGAFVDDMLLESEAGVLNLLFDADGLIKAHPSPHHVPRNSLVETPTWALRASAFLPPCPPCAASVGTCSCSSIWISCWSPGFPASDPATRRLAARRVVAGGRTHRPLGAQTAHGPFQWSQRGGGREGRGCRPGDGLQPHDRRHACPYGASGCASSPSAPRP